MIKYAAYTNRLEYMYSIDMHTAENLQYAESKIRDADMAEEIVRDTRWSIMQQAATAVLAQARTSMSTYLKLMR